MLLYWHSYTHIKMFFSNYGHFSTYYWYILGCKQAWRSNLLGGKPLKIKIILGEAVWETIFFKHSPKWRVDWNKYSPKGNRARHVWRVTFFLNSPRICNKYQINNTVMFNNLFCRFWQVINLVKKDQHTLESCVDLFFLNFKF